jgi:hypothetical protein
MPFQPGNSPPENPAPPAEIGKKSTSSASDLGASTPCNGPKYPSTDLVYIEVGALRWHPGQTIFAVKADLVAGRERCLDMGFKVDNHD